MAGAMELECTGTGRRLPSEEPHGLSPEGWPLYARYAAVERREARSPEQVVSDRSDLWRYEAVLPVRDSRARVALGEGGTPLLDAPELAASLGFKRVFVKNEGVNPTGSFKDRGMAVAVSRAVELGARELAVPSAGNAAGAAAAYGASAGLPVHVVVPRTTPEPILEEIRALGGRLRFVDGHIGDCGRLVREKAETEGWYDLSTLREPYRVEGKKTMGYELFEQLGGRLPEAIVYPAGGGTGLVGMWKAFHEMEALGWIGPERPRMFAVQAEGCAPVVDAWTKGEGRASPWENPRTYASGLRVPAAVGDFLMLEAIRESGGAAVAVPDTAMVEEVARMGRTTGVFAAPEGGAVAAGAVRFQEEGWLKADSEVVLFNTGSGLKYVGSTPEGAAS